MHERRIWRVDQNSWRLSTRVGLDERIQGRSRDITERLVRTEDGRVQKVGNKFTGWMTGVQSVQNTNTHNVVHPYTSHNIRLCQVRDGCQPPPAFHDESNRLTTKSLTEPTWLSRRVVWFAWTLGPKQPLRTGQRPGDRSFSTLQPRRHCPGRPWTLPAPSLQLVPCWQPPGIPRLFSPLLTFVISRYFE